MIVILIFVLLIPVAGAAASWALLRRQSPPLAWLAGLLAGVAPVVLFTNALQAGPGMGSDPDPQLFQTIAIGMAALVALLTLAALHFAARRPG